MADNMKMIFKGKVRSLMAILIMMRKAAAGPYRREHKEGKFSFYWGDDFSPDMKAQSSFIVDVPDKSLARQMDADYRGLKGRLKRGTLRGYGVKVEMVE